jgi:excisionase family DNA binding protein
MKSSTQTHSELLTLVEVAATLRVKVSTIRSWRLQRKHLVFRKIGGKVLVHRDDLASLIASAAGGAGEGE